MNIRHKFKITLEEEDLLVKELVDIFRTIFEQNAEHKFSGVLTKLLSLEYECMKMGDVINVSYDQDFNMGALQVMINNVRSRKRPGKPNPKRR